MESTKPPLKDRGNMVTSVVSPKVSESSNNSDGCNEDITGKASELHNGGADIDSANANENENLKPKKENNENVQDQEHASDSGEKWKLNLDLSDSASTSDNDGSEIETSGIQKDVSLSSVVDDATEENEFKGFASLTLSPCEVQLTRLIACGQMKQSRWLQFCCNPYKKQKHSRFTKDLRNVTDWMCNLKYDIQMGMKVCTACRKQLGKEKTISEEVSTLDQGANQDDDYCVNTGQIETSLERAIAENAEACASRERSMLDVNLDDSGESFFSTYIPAINDDSGMEIDEGGDVKFKLKIVSDPFDTPLKEEAMDEESYVEETHCRSEDDRSSEIQMRKDKPDETIDADAPASDVASRTNTNENKHIADISESSRVDPSGKTDGVTGFEEMSSEVTSSATSSPASAISPSVSSRASIKISRHSRGDSPAVTGSGGKGKKYSVDMSNPAFLKPFEYGWKRELVFRKSCESTFKRMADIYYYTPKGKKVRSNREVLEHLDGSNLTLENFTFFKDPIGLNDPSKEIIRDAKIVTKDPNATPRKAPKPKQVTPKSSPLPDASRSNVALLGPKGPQLGRIIPPKAFPKIKVASIKVTKPLVTKPTPSKPKNEGDGEMEMGMLPPTWSPSQSPFVKKTAGNSEEAPGASWTPAPKNRNKKITEPCSILCGGGFTGLIPSLQCRLCLCLFHPECVGLARTTETIHSYVCKNCQEDGKPPTATIKAVITNSNSTSPPPLTPISTLGTTNRTSPTENSQNQLTTTTSSSSPPKLQRLPRKLITVPQFVKVPKNKEPILSPQQVAKHLASKGTIVGSVTTWLPPSSTIQLTSSAGAITSSPVTTSYNNNNSVATTTTLSDSSTTSTNTTTVQTIARMGGKKYIVVPKHNVLSVSPAMAATATTPASKSSMQVGDPTPLGDKPPVTFSTSLVLTNSTGHTTTVLGGTQALIGQPQIGTQALIGQPQVLMTSSASTNGDQTINLLQGTTPITNLVTSSCGPILPTPSAYFVSTAAPVGLQNPPGVLLVPQPQYLLLNGPSGNIILGNQILPPQPAKPADASVKTGDAATGPADGIQRDSEEASTKGGKRKQPMREYEGPATKRLKTNVVNTEAERQFMQFFMSNVCTGYSSLLHVFQYLKVQELLRAARVCRMWHDVASHPSLWRTVRMKNSHVGDWEGLVKSLRRHETQHLDLRKMLIPSEDKSNSMWDNFCTTIGKATSLKRIDFCRCPAKVVESVAESCPQLTIINALVIKSSSISLKSIGNLKHLVELRLKSQNNISLSSTTLEPLKQLASLRHLSLTTFKDLGKKKPNVLRSLTNLESLELGECSEFPEDFGPETLACLTKLERLRLEKGQGPNSPNISILTGISSLPKLIHLELINFDVKPGFDKCLAQCTNIRRMLIIPTYVQQSATTNHMVLNGVIQLKDSLTQFVWGVTHELLRVTELFVDQCEGQKEKAPSGKSGKKSVGSDSIPILKPICKPSESKDSDETEKEKEEKDSDKNNKIDKPIDGVEVKEDKKEFDINESEEENASAAAPQVEILPLPKLQKLLTSSLPNTKVKILKIPFHATWRQTISDPAP